MTTCEVSNLDYVKYIIVRNLKKTNEGIWLTFSPSEARLKNLNAEQRQSGTLTFGICEASEARIYKLAKA